MGLFSTPTDEEQGWPVYPAPYRQTLLGKIGHALGTGERLGVRTLVLPMLRQTNPDAYDRLKALGIPQSEVMAGDVVRAVSPDTGKVGAALGGIVLGGLVDPLTYIGGGLSKAGHIAEEGATLLRQGLRTGKLAEEAGLTSRGLRGLALAEKAAARPLDLLDTARAAGESTPVLARRLLNEAGNAVVPPLASQQALAGQRDLLHLAIPGTERRLGTLPLLPKVVSAKAYQTLERIQRGELLHNYDFLQSNSVGQWFNRIGANIDQAGTRLLQTFNVGAGVNRYAWLAWKNLMAKIHGHGQETVRQYTETLEPLVDAVAEHLGQAVGKSPAEVRPALSRILSEMNEADPYIQLARDASGNLLTRPSTTRMSLPTRLSTGELVPGEPLQEIYPVKGLQRDNFARARDAVVREFGLPPDMGPPASILDTGFDRKLRTLANQVNEMNHAIYQKEVEELHKSMLLRVRPGSDANYQYHLLTEEANRIRAERSSEIWAAAPKNKGKRPPTTTHTSMLGRRMLFIDPDNLEMVKDQLSAVEYGGKKFDLYKRLVSRGGALPTNKDLKLLRAAQLQGAFGERGTEAYDTWNSILVPMSTTQVNEWVYKNGLGQFIKPGEVKQWFVEDPTVLMAARNMKADRAILSGQFFDELKARPDVMVSERIKGLHDNWMQPNVPELAGYYMHPQTARWLNRTAQAERNPGRDLAEFSKLWGQATRLWKGWTLAVFPVYHIRNMIGNLWNYYLDSPNAYTATENLGVASKALEAIARGKSTQVIDKMTGRMYETKELYEQAASRGAFGIGFIGADKPGTIAAGIRQNKLYGPDYQWFPNRDWVGPHNIVQRVAQTFKKNGAVQRWGGITAPSEEVAKGLIHNPLSVENWYTEAGFKFGNAVDSYTRFAHIIQSMRHGSTIDDAVMAAKSAFFDYHDLSPLERNVLRPIFPFYAWSRKNIPFQLEMLVQHPDRIARFAGGLHGFNGWRNPSEEQYLNDYMRENFPLRIRKNKNGMYEYFLFRNWLPLVDINDLMEPVKWATQSLHPGIKQVAEQAVNMNFFTRRKLDYLNSLVGGERTPVLKTQLPNRLVNIVRSIRPINTLSSWVDNPNELDFVSHLLRFGLGRVYPLDPSRSQHEFAMKMNDLQQDIRRAIKAAYWKHAGPEEMQRLMVQAGENRAKLMEQFGQGGFPSVTPGP